MPHSILHVNRGPGPVIVIRSEDAGRRWCFGCRTYHGHRHELLGYDCDPLDDYYGPWWVCKCNHCGQDRTRFPG